MLVEVDEGEELLDEGVVKNESGAEEEIQEHHLQVDVLSQEDVVLFDEEGDELKDAGGFSVFHLVTTSLEKNRGDVVGLAALRKIALVGDFRGRGRSTVNLEIAVVELLSEETSISCAAAVANEEASHVEITIVQASEKDGSDNAVTSDSQLVIFLGAFVLFKRRGVVVLNETTKTRSALRGSRGVGVLPALNGAGNGVVELVGDVQNDVHGNRTTELINSR